VSPEGNWEVEQEVRPKQILVIASSHAGLVQRIQRFTGESAWRDRWRALPHGDAVPPGMVAVIEEDATRARKSIAALIAAGVPAEQVLLAAVPFSIPHAILIRETGLAAFAFSPWEDRFDELYLRATAAASQVAGLFLDREIKRFQETGALELLSAYAGMAGPADGMERARLANAAASVMGLDFPARRRTIRLAMFWDLGGTAGWERIVDGSRALWEIKALLAEAKDLRARGAVRAVWPESTSVEAAIVGTCVLAQACAADAAAFRPAFRAAGARLPEALAEDLQKAMDQCWKGEERADETLAA
jgi:hypothetical protein